MKKIFVIISVILLLILGACSLKQFTESKTSENSEIVIGLESEQSNETQEETKSETAEKKSKYKGYKVKEVYINGQKRDIDYSSHGDHYHVKVDRVEYTLSKKDFNNLLFKDNKVEFKKTEDISNKSESSNIVSYYKHGDHWHVKTYDGREYITHTDPTKTTNVNQITVKEEVKLEKKDNLFDKVYLQDDHYHVWYKGKEYAISKQEYDKSIKENKFDIPKEEVHVEKIETLPTIDELLKTDKQNKKDNNQSTSKDNEENDNKHDPISETKDESNVEVDETQKERERLLLLAQEKIEEIVRKYNISKDKIKIDLEKNLLIYPHGNHYHYDKIDDSKVADNSNNGHNHDHNHNHDHKEPEKNPEVETKRIYGPYKANTTNLFLNKEKAIKELGITDIKNPHNYNFLTFFTDSKEDGFELELNGEKSYAFVYLVLHGSDLSVLDEIKIPSVSIENYVLRRWVGAALEDIVKRDVARRAQVRIVNHEERPKVKGPFTVGDDVSNLGIDLRDYYRVEFAATSTFQGQNDGGYLELDGRTSTMFYYFIRDDISISDAMENGYNIPTPMANSEFEFIGWTDEPTQGNFMNKYFALFGAKQNVIAVYQPSNLDYPINPNDPNRPHPRGSVFYDETKYTSFVIIAGENGTLDYEGIESKAFIFIVRKGTSYKQLASFYPFAIASDGYKENLDYYDLLSDDSPIKEDSIFTVEFEESNGGGFPFFN